MPSQQQVQGANDNSQDSTAMPSSSSNQNLYDRFFQPFSAGATKLLPPKGAGMRFKSKRADRIPDDPARPLVNDLHSIDDPAMRLRVPKKIPTPVKVEAKVWFANERTFISYVSTGLLLSSIASGLLLGAKDSMARWFALAYAIISAGILIYGWIIFQRRLTMISARDAGSFDIVWGPLAICVALFFAILINFIVRVQEAKRVSGVSVVSFTQVWSSIPRGA
ncbi:putative vacuole fusion, non-autophagic-related protein [Kockovaella imperatae]|uniref:Putative vacuole fusion, non-autophagic-related protein n=1 Tax=Kockovaella imperatae TaxID=4999 RepID=A0A1Y1UK72_9TREE|nr:putative vacuole fusion, non-autophagic-related protein [Kockovaella imperatae]ORX38460.1 putative vacuole fusion, non-autophagic-related protein [Kockovaella imperatae]